MSLLIEAPPRQWLRSPSPALIRIETETAPRTNRAVARRLAWIWGLLLLNVTPYSGRSTLIPLPLTVGKVLTQGALILALVLALSINRRVVVRPNAFLFLMTVVCATSGMVTLRGQVSLIGSDYRWVRLVLMVAVLWLLTPWWGRDDLLLLRLHRRFLFGVLLLVLAGILVSPGAAFASAGGGRLGGTIWPIPPTQVAHYAAVVAGLTVVLWLAGLMRGRTAVGVAGLALVVLVLTHTRTALVAMLVGVLAAGLSLFLTRQRVRKALGISVAVAALVALSFAPTLRTWFDRGESGQLDKLSGRTATWSALVAEPRTEFNRVFGFGISNEAFDGAPIDSSWLSTYQDQGLVGDALDGLILVVLGAVACASPRGPRRALALFLIGFCAVSSYTETGLGEATPYLLDLTVAMAVLGAPAAAVSQRVRPVS